MTALPLYIYDGGRRAAGLPKPASDCVARSVAIATQRPYIEVFIELARINAAMRRTKGRTTAGLSTANHGIYTTSQLFKRYMAKQGFEWTPTMSIGSGCKVHLAEGELPKGRLVVAVSKHYTAVIDGVVWDTHDPCRGGMRCVYGIWRLA
jgi:hypothetical protein